MKVNLSELSPWAEVSRLFSNMKSLEIQGFNGEAELELSETGVLSVKKVKKAKK